MTKYIQFKVQLISCLIKWKFIFMFLKNSELMRDGYSSSDQKSLICVLLSLLIPQIILNYRLSFVLHLKHLHRIFRHYFYELFTLPLIVPSHWNSQTIILNLGTKIVLFITGVGIFTCFHVMPLSFQLWWLQYKMKT